VLVWGIEHVSSLVTLLTLSLLIVFALCFRKERNTPNIFTSLFKIICFSAIPAALLSAMYV